MGTNEQLSTGIQKINLWLISCTSIYTSFNENNI